MNNSYLLSFLSQRNIPTITRKHHAYLTYCGLEQQYTYILKEGVVKTSIILKDGREFNIAYLKGPNIISLLRDEISSYTSAPFNVRVETEEATFYLIPRVEFWNYINNDRKLQDYVKEYYQKAQENQAIMNGMKDAPETQQAQPVPQLNPAPTPNELAAPANKK